MSKVMVGTPVYDGKVSIDTALFLAEARAKGAEIYPVTHQPTLVARNLMAFAAKLLGFDYLIMVDGDAAPPKGAYEKLLYDAVVCPSVIGVPYLIQPGMVAVEVPPDQDPFSLKGLLRVLNVGTHLVIYDVKVFDAIEPPWFQDEYNKNWTARTDTEDCVCHRRMREKGVPIYCDFDLWTDHLVTRRLSKPEA